MSRAEFVRQHYAGNKRAIKKIITAGQAPGLLAYADGEPIGWCAIAPLTDAPHRAVLRQLTN